MLLPLLIVASAVAQDPLADLPNLIGNGGFEAGTVGWQVSLGAATWGAGPAEVQEREADAGANCLRLSAVGLDGEVDVTRDPVAVQAGTAYLLLARVKQLAGEGGYKVTLDWQDADGRHLAYANDWLGNDHPASFADHGGVFVAPEDAERVVIILGVSKGAECLFDEVRLAPLPGGSGEDVPDGSGRVEADVPATVEAGDHGTFRFTYHAGEPGLPTGASVYLRRDNIDPSWSAPQTSDPKAAGYLTVTAPNGARCMIVPGSASVVPSVTRITVVYPPLQAGDTLSITYGDTSGGGPGAQAQRRAEEGLHFVLSVDGDRDDRPLDLPDTPAFDVVANRGRMRADFVTPLVVEAGVPFRARCQAQDGYGNAVAADEGELTVAEEIEVQGREPRKVPLGRAPIVQGRAEVEVTLNTPGRRQLEARALNGGSTGPIIVSRAATRPPGVSEAGARVSEQDGTYILENPHVRLLLPRNEFGYGVAFLEARLDGHWQQVGTLPWGAAIETGGVGYAHRGGEVYPTSATVLAEGPDSAVLRLRGVQTVGGVEWRAELELSLGAQARHIGYRCSATPAEAVSLKGFTGPLLLAGDGSFGSDKDSALFPGLEYLTAGEVSSGDYGIVPPHSARWAPHPYKVTLPVMAVAGDGLAVGLAWDAARPWSEGRGVPQPRFSASTRDRADRLSGHPFMVGAPSVPDGLPESEASHETLWPIAPGQTLTLTASLIALAPARDVTEVVRYWFEVNGVPEPPAAPRDPTAQAELTARGLLETAWDGEKRGWHNALADPWGAAYNDRIALRLEHYARARPDSPLTSRIDAELAEAFAAAGGRRGYDLAFHGGDPVKAWEAERAAGLRDALGMAADGSYAYHPHTGNKLFTQAQAKSLGKDGEVNIGTCVMGLEPLLRRALLTGDPFLIAQGEKGLSFIEQFTRPQGAENWEVPLACPNLRASALALRCYLYGYLLTGKGHYLERARYWATTGLPFIYAWNAADRPIMRYASISVMGTTLHTHTWFGKPVQWVGLVYADALLELAAHDDSFPWRRIAEGLLTCATQMQKTVAEPCGHVGFYPDAYNVMEGQEAYHWCLAPTLIADVTDALSGQDPKASTTILRAGDRRLHLTGPGVPGDATLDGDTLRFTARYLPGSEYQVLISPIAAAAEVLVDASALPAGAWEVVAPGLLRLSVRQTGDAAQVEVRGLRLGELAPALSAEGLLNGDFERGLEGWAPPDPQAARLSDESHGGASALLLDGRGLTAEVQCPSLPVRVEAGRAYELTAWVKQVAGDGQYKVTLDWLGAGGHLGYDNDWTGTDRPAAYSRHGGRFTAPPGAQAAVIILGVRPGTACLFDDLSLTPADAPGSRR